MEHFFENRKVSVTPPQLHELIDTLQFIKDLEKIYFEMQVQERRFLIQIVRQAGSTSFLPALTLALTVALTTYTAMAFGITPILTNRYAIVGATWSGIIAVLICGIMTLLLEAAKKYYEKVCIEEFDLAERQLFSNYFSHFGNLQFNQCIQVVEEMSTELKIPIEYRWRKLLLHLAKQCQELLILETSSLNIEPEEFYSSKDFTFSMAKQLGVSSSLIREKSDLSSSEQLNNANFQRFCFLDDIAMQPL